jgi:hypothetical protein
MERPLLNENSTTTGDGAAFNPALVFNEIDELFIEMNKAGQKEKGMKETGNTNLQKEKELKRTHSAPSNLSADENDQEEEVSEPELHGSPKIAFGSEFVPQRKTLYFPHFYLFPPISFLW